MNTNIAVIEVGENKLIIDVGSGSRFIGSTGKLFDNLSKANIDPDSITHVFLTHANSDKKRGSVVLISNESESVRCFVVIVASQHVLDSVLRFPV